MTEIVKINLENEMDLILAHKRTMKLVELCGMSQIVQTTFATAVSEIARCVIGTNSRSSLALGLSSLKLNRKELQANIVSDEDFTIGNDTAIKYAVRLANDLKISKSKGQIQVTIKQGINYSGLINDARVEAFVTYFKKELPVSPYDELRKKNIQLIELSEKLRDSETQYRVLAETLPLMIFSINTQGYLTYANKWLKDFFNIPESEVQKHNWMSFLDLEDKAKKIRESWDQAQVTQLLFKTEARLRTNTGSHERLWHLVSLTPAKNEQGKLFGWTGFFADIHAQKKIEETLKNNVELKAIQKQLLTSQYRLEEKVKELNRSNHDLEQFAYIASHDLQEPLRKIRNFTELLETHIEDRDLSKKFMVRIDESASRMSRLIQDVLNYSRLTKTETVFEEVSLDEILDEVKKDTELLIEEKKVTITCKNLIAISGIKQQLKQLFYNLINNSIKFSRENPLIEVSLRNLSPEEVKSNPELHANLKHIELTFKDNGIGFDQKYAGQLFTIFKRLHTSSHAGTGIGLALCKKIVNNHHGTIQAKGELNKGAEFIVVLPVE